MAHTTKAEILDAGVLFDGSDAEKLAFYEAFYGALMGSDQINGGVGYGTFHLRRSIVETVTVSGDTGTPSKPGPVLSVEITAGGVTGLCLMRTGVAAATLEVQISPVDSTGRDKMFFLAADAVTEVQIRYLPMSQVMYDALHDTHQ